jgi:hypothetical protein
MPLSRSVAANMEGRAHQAFGNVEPTDAAQGIFNKAGLPCKLAGIGHALPRATAANVGMRAWGRALLGGMFHNIKEFSLAKTFFDGSKAHANALAHKSTLNEDGHAFIGAANGTAIGGKAVKRKFQSVALFVFHKYSPCCDAPS